MQESKESRNRFFKLKTMAWPVLFYGVLVAALAVFACMPAASLALNKTDWTFLGPLPVAQSTPADSKTNLSGRITGIAAHPSDASIFYVASAGGGVWKTTDGGTTWTQLTDSKETLSMGAIAVATQNPNMIYAGTGEANNRWDSNYGRGILVSADGGATWTLRTAGGAFDRLATSKIVVDPGDSTGNTAYAAMARAGINGLSVNTGIWKTTDGGVNWTNTTSLIDGTDTTTVSWSDVAIDQNNPTTLYAAIGEPHGSFLNGVYKSINGGGSWVLLANAPSGDTTGRITVALSKSNPQVLYVSVSSPLSATLGELSLFVRSDDGGTSFTDLTAGTPNYMGVQGYYDTALIVDPTNSGIVYAGGQQGANSILRSTDGGVNWTDISSGGASNSATPHINTHAFAITSGGRLLIGDDGGIYRLDDPVVPFWTNLNSKLGTVLFYGIGLHPTDPFTVVGGTADNGTILTTGSPVWTITDADGAGFDGGVVRFSQNNPSRVYHQSPPYSAGWDFFRVSNDGGNTWTTMTNTMLVSGQLDLDQSYAPFIVDPANGNHVLYGTARVWETQDGGADWTIIGDVGTGGFNSSGNRVDAIALAASDVDRNTIYVATGGESATTSQIFFTNDHGATWSDISLGVSGRVKDIQVDPSDALVAYAVISTFNSPNGQVYMTTNGGGNWSDITNDLPVQPVWSLQIDPSTTPATLYVGADDGVYVSTNGGVNWSRFGNGLPNAQVYQVELNANLNILGAATHGRGLWEIMTPNAENPPTVTLDSPVDGASFTQPVSISLSATATASGSATISKVEFYSGSTLIGTSADTSSPYTFNWENAPSGTFTLTAEAFDNNGASSVSNAVSVTIAESPALEVSPSSASYGNVSVGFTSSPLSFKITNNGLSGLPLTVDSIDVSGTDLSMFSVSNGTCGSLPAIIPAGSSCSFSVSFSPTSTGAKTASIDVVTLADGSKSVSVSGTGATASDPVRITSPTSSTFGTLADAFAAATGNATLQAMNLTLSAPTVTVNSTGTVNFTGGYDALWGTRTGVTTMQGVLTVQSGTLVVNGLAIK